MTTRARLRHTFAIAIFDNSQICMKLLVEFTHSMPFKTSPSQIHSSPTPTAPHQISPTNLPPPCHQIQLVSVSARTVPQAFIHSHRTNFMAVSIAVSVRLFCHRTKATSILIQHHNTLTKCHRWLVHSYFVYRAPIFFLVRIIGEKKSSSVAVSVLTARRSNGNAGALNTGGAHRIGLLATPATEHIPYNKPTRQRSTTIRVSCPKLGHGETQREEWSNGVCMLSVNGAICQCSGIRENECVCVYG